MLKAYAYRFVKVCFALEGLKKSFREKTPPSAYRFHQNYTGDPVQDGRLMVGLEIQAHELRSEERRDIGSPLVGLIDDMNELGISASLRLQVQDLKSSFNSEGEKYANMVDQIERGLEAELKDSLFLAVPRAASAFYDKPDLFGSEVQVKFSKASFNIQEAGNCFALRRYTAAVFHLMCVLEIGLDSLAHALNLPYSEKNWQTIIDRIKTAIDALPTTGPNWKKTKTYYSRIAMEFSFLKDAHRNHVAHGRAKFTEDEARSIFDHVKAFMVQLTERLQERP